METKKCCPEATKKLFEKYDTDKDGFITMAELKAGCKDCPEYKAAATPEAQQHLAKMFEKYDTNMDKKLSCEEFCKLMAGEPCCGTKGSEAHKDGKTCSGAGMSKEACSKTAATNSTCGGVKGAECKDASKAGACTT